MYLLISETMNLILELILIYGVEYISEFMIFYFLEKTATAAFIVAVAANSVAIVAIAADSVAIAAAFIVAVATGSVAIAAVAAATAKNFKETESHLKISSEGVFLIRKIKRRKK